MSKFYKHKDGFNGSSCVVVEIRDDDSCWMYSHLGVATKNELPDTHSNWLSYIAQGIWVEVPKPDIIDKAIEYIPIPRNVLKKLAKLPMQFIYNAHVRDEWQCPCCEAMHGVTYNVKGDPNPHNLKHDDDCPHVWAKQHHKD